MKPKATLRHFLAAIGCATIAISSASAATYYWDSNVAAAGFGSLDGIWGTSTFWSTSSLGTATPANTTITTLDDINFGTAADAYSGIVTLNGDKVARGATFAGSSTVTLKGNGTARRLTLGSGGLTMNNTSTVTMGDGVAGNNLLIGLGATGQTWTNNTANNLTILNTAATFTRIAGGTLTFNKVGAGNFVMSTAVLPNDATGIVGPWALFGAGTSIRYAINNAGAIAGYSAGTAAADAEAFTSSTTNYDFSTTGTTTLTGNRTAHTIRYTGTGNVIDLGAAGTNTLTTNGILAAGASGTLTIQRTGGTGTLKAGSTGTNSELVIAGPQNISITAPISNGTGASTVTYSGTGTLTLGGDNTYTGGTRVNSGTLLANSATALGAAGGSLGVYGSGTLDLNGFNANAGAFNGDNGSAIVTNSAAGDVKELTVGTGNTAGNFAGVISGNLRLIKTGSGALTLSAANSFTGGLTLNGGTVNVVNATDSLGAAGGTITVLSNSTLQQGGSGAISLNKSIALNGGTLTFVHGNAGFTILGAVTGSGAIKPNDSGGVYTRTLNLQSIANTFTGLVDMTNNRSAIAVNSIGDASGAGNIVFVANTNGAGFKFGAGGVGPSSSLVLNHRKIQFTGANGGNSLITNDAATAYTFTINTALDASAATGTRTLQLDGTNTGNNAFNGIIANGGLTTLNLIKSGAGTWMLGGANGYTGTTTVTDGTLIARSASALGAGSGANVSVATNKGLIYNAAADAQLSIGGTLAITGGTSTVIGTSIGSTATSAAINVAGTATITNAAHRINMYGVAGVTHATGAVTLIQGTGLSILNPATVPTLGTVFNNTDFTINTTGGDGGTSAFTRTATELKVNLTAATPFSGYFWKGGLSGNTTVWAASNGTSASNWATTTGGAVQALVPGTGADVTIDGAFATAPTSTALGADMSIKTLSITNAGGFGLNSDSFKLTITPGSSSTGITMASGVAASTIGANIGMGAAQTWTNNSTTGALTASGVISGGSTLEKAGTGTLALTGNNTYTGATNVNEGTLVVNGRITNSALTTVKTGATLGGSGSIGALTIDSGGFFAPGSSPGTTTVEGDYIQNGSLVTEITGLTAGTQHDQVLVNATTTLNGLLSLTMNTFTPAEDDLIFILLNDSNDAITGTFTGLTQGAVATTYGGFNWQISYIGDSTGDTFTGGNDVALMAVAVPEPSAAALLGGFGLLAMLRRRRN